MEEYEPKKIEKKWQKLWEKEKLYRAKDFSKKPKKYILFEFPYPSGEGLHVGHCRSYCALDAVVRKKRMEGYNVLFPIGWDAFGLPAENYALKTGIHPKKTTAQNIANFKRQYKRLGISLDWEREINTTDPKYYKYTQWIFLKLFEKGLAYQAEMPINWCPSCKIGLANEEVIEGKCERCGTQTEKKILKQWMLKITAYADRLIDDLKKVDYPERVKAQQINWIGKSEGTEIRFTIYDLRFTINVFTTRLDTIFGCTYLVIAPEHEIVKNLEFRIKNLKEVKDYIEKSRKKSDLERTELIKEKTGVELKGIKAINPFNQKEIPIFVADYVLPHYGTGAIMAVPVHDERDLEFSKKYKLPTKRVIRDQSIEVEPQYIREAFTEDGVLINSGRFSGLNSERAREEMIAYAKKNKFGRKTINYKLRDWIFSRQHYWGEPIPIIHCEKYGAVPVSEKDLPVELPYIKKYQPTGTGKSPLAVVKKWVNCKCPKCGGKAKRETDTMPNWAGSSWYFLRYIDPHNDKALASKKKLKYWLPVDWYNGGMEHTTLHLLYSRFWYKFLFDIGVVPQDEPYQKRTSHGIVLAEDGRKMSKSFGNIISPDDVVQKYGADTLRVYEMFMGPYGQAIAWNTKGVVGMRRFLQKVWELFGKLQITNKSQTNHKSQITNTKLERLVHQTIKKVSEDIENLKFNTAVSQLMILINEMEKQKELSVISYQLLLKLLSPFAPHLAEELYQRVKSRPGLDPIKSRPGLDSLVKKSIFQEKWPKYDPKLVKEKKIILIIQVNGKVRDKVEVQADISEQEAKKLTLSREKVKKWIEGKPVKKTIFVKGKLINIVI